ncbi:MAG TPA: NUDIX hydrolase [Candidatus Saccharimonadales bacterium]|nr:NUDIX hydrolase [Candidatus Saccharimonadales bacterium]
MTLVAKALIFDADDNILLLRRSGTHPRFPYDIDLPGGEVEENEDAVEAVIREIFEEAGLEVLSKDISLAYEHTTNERHHVLFTVHIAQSSPVVVISWEHDAHEWVSRDEIMSREAKDDYMSIVKTYFDSFTTV